MTDTEGLKYTPLYHEHVSLGAKIVPFAGWAMPVLYRGLIAEHSAVRTDIGLFDVSHMGEILVVGKDSEKFLDYVTCNKITSLYDGKAQYNAMLNETGGVVDDIIVYRFTQEKFMLCVNASNIEKDFEWLKRKSAQFTVTLENQSDAWGLIALQGPHSGSVLSRFVSGDIKRFHFIEAQLFGVDTLIARTGYTGEDGYEIFAPSSRVTHLWRELIKFGITPCGLGARDTLRLEAAYPLYGHELRDEWLANECGIGWIVKLDKPDFIGKKALSSELKNTLVGIELTEPGIAREGYKIFSEEGSEIGLVTSGTKTPTTHKAIAMAHLEISLSEPGSIILVEVRGKKLKARIVELPFYKK